MAVGQGRARCGRETVSVHPAAPPRPRQASKPSWQRAASRVWLATLRRDHRACQRFACEPTACDTSRSATRTRSGRRSGRPSAGRTSWSRPSAAMPDRSTWSPTSAVNGYTSADLIHDEMPALAGLRPDFVTLLIGVNDVVQGVAPATYAANVAAILDGLLGLLPADRIVTVATPDYTVTPAGSDYGDPRQQHDGDRAPRTRQSRLAAERGIAYVDILDLSLRAADGSVARRRRRAPPERRPVRAVGRADRAGRRGAHRALILRSTGSTRW